MSSWVRASHETHGWSAPHGFRACLSHGGACACITIRISSLTMGQHICLEQPRDLLSCLSACKLFSLFVCAGVVMGALAAGVALLFMKMVHAVHDVVHHMRLNVRPPCLQHLSCNASADVQALQVSACSVRCFMASLWALYLGIHGLGGLNTRVACQPSTVVLTTARRTRAGAQDAGGMRHAGRAADRLPCDCAAAGGVLGRAGDQHAGRPHAPAAPPLAAGAHCLSTTLLHAAPMSVAIYACCAYRAFAFPFGQLCRWLLFLVARTYAQRRARSAFCRGSVC